MTEKKSRTPLANRRDFLKKAGTAAAGAAAVTATTFGSAPYAFSKTNPIKWRLQTYSGAPLGAHVIKPQIEAFNRAAHGQMEIELYYADQLVPTNELFRAMQNGTIDAVQSDDASMASPTSMCLGGIFRFPPGTAWTCRGCSSITAWTGYGNRPMMKSKMWTGSVPVPGTPVIFLPRNRSAAWQT